MEARAYRRMCEIVDQVSPYRRVSKQQFGDHVIVKVYLYSVLRDRPVSFVTQKENWDQKLLDELIGDLPSQPTMSRRMKSIGVLSLLERTQVLLAENDQQTLVKFIDSKPLKVGSYSKDREARRGRAAGEMARGYKIHVISSGNAVLCWTLTAMNTNDQLAAQKLLPQLQGEGYIAADNSYDGNGLHLKAWENRHQMLTPTRKGKESKRDLRRTPRPRLRSQDMLDPRLKHHAEESFGQGLMRSRKAIERHFGHQVMLGMQAPPPWVRTPHRVATWAAGKMIQSMCRLQQLKKMRRR